MMNTVRSDQLVYWYTAAHSFTLQLCQHYVDGTVSDLGIQF